MALDRIKEISSVKKKTKDKSRFLYIILFIVVIYIIQIILNKMLLKQLYECNAKYVHILLALGADPNCSETTVSEYPDHPLWLIFTGYPNCVEIATQKAYDCSQGFPKSHHGSQKLYRQYIKILHLLLKYGGDPNNNGGDFPQDEPPPLLYAHYNWMKTDWNITELLLKYGGNPSYWHPEIFKCELVDEAIQSRHYQITKMAIENSGSCNSISELNSPMVEACSTLQPRMVKLLLKYHASPTMLGYCDFPRDSCEIKISPLQAAKLNESANPPAYLEVVKLLRHAGAK